MFGNITTLNLILRKKEYQHDGKAYLWQISCLFLLSAIPDFWYVNLTFRFFNCVHWWTVLYFRQWTEQRLITPSVSEQRLSVAHWNDAIYVIALWVDARIFFSRLCTIINKIHACMFNVISLKMFTKNTTQRAGEIEMVV